MMATSAKEKFDAAVKVIRGLPANGPFQPSHELMLKFYSYFKQATEGKCTLPKPSFWDIVNKKKWEAWSKLGDMEKDKAMLLYVDELKKVSNHVKETYYPAQIVETMPQTEEVGVFLQKLDTFYEMVEETTHQENNNVKESDDSEHAGGDVILPNGNVKALGDHGREGNEDLNYSDNLSQILKQDMKKAQESSGILLPKDKHNGHGPGNGHHARFAHQPLANGGRQHDDEDDDDSNDDDDDEEDDDDESEREDLDQNNQEESEEEEEFIKVETGQKLSASVPNTKHSIHKDGRKGGGGRAGGRKEEKEEQGGNGSNRKWNGVSAWSEESETENEEFCDTSDEPINQTPPSPSSPSSQRQPYSHSTTTNTTTTASNPNIPLNTSTPIPHTHHTSSSKTAQMVNGNYHHHHNPRNKLLSDSLEVNASGIDDDRRVVEETLFSNSTAPPANFSLFAGTTSTNTTVTSQEFSSFSRDSGGSSVINGGGVDRLMEAEVNCRGGEEEEGRDRRRKGGSSQSARGGAGTGARRGVGGAGPGRSDGGARPPYPNRGGGGGNQEPSQGGDARNDLNEQIVVTLLRLQRDMSGVLNRLHSLEALVKEGRKEREERKRMANKSWWPFPDLSFKSAAIIILWPIVLQVVLAYLSRRRSRRLGK